jgi:hypothetical protein
MRLSRALDLGSLDVGTVSGSRGEKPPCARQRGNREEVHDEHTVVGPASPRRAPLRIVGRHEVLHVRQGKPGRPVLWRLAAESLDNPGHSRARVHGRAHRPRRVPLAAAADDPGCRGLGGREPRVRRGARQVPRGRAHDLERRAGPPHGVHRVWPDGSAANIELIPKLDTLPFIEERILIGAGKSKSATNAC